MVLASCDPSFTCLRRHSRRLRESRLTCLDSSLWSSPTQSATGQRCPWISRRKARPVKQTTPRPLFAGTSGLCRPGRLHDLHSGHLDLARQLDELPGEILRRLLRVARKLALSKPFGIAASWIAPYTTHVETDTGHHTTPTDHVSLHAPGPKLHKF